ncbi:acyltransferase family protein [Aestuariivivens sediminicola]|uniref:acyltransferase family protein n=1 Tax=Aestuariivivens sediminicola TaxID=2913560 RepID=UPI001F581597|nr:acyltransferase family protein [Aestuariivivens sediminicola]
MDHRYRWVDQARGLGIFLVIYGHNFPIIESYIYSFHVPLFFFIAGMFHPKKVDLEKIIHRAKCIIIPYFAWSFMLYGFWFLIGRHYGNSKTYDLDPLKEFLGVFYAQGGIQFMDWGIPMWFLPCIFLSFLLFSLILEINNRYIQYIVFIILLLFGVSYPVFFEVNLPWSFDVACVSLFFYGLGFVLKNKLITAQRGIKSIGVLLLCLMLSLISGLINSKVDMYRSDYGNIILFLISGLAGCFFVLLFFKIFRMKTGFAFLGRNTIPILALHLRALTVIKLALVGIGITLFNFSEHIKLGLVFLQILLLLPIVLLINKYMPILNGKVKK